MTISIWRYSHLALAIASFIFVFLASVTGIILAFQPISEKIQPYKIEDFDQITLGETLQVFKSRYADVLSLEVDPNDFVVASVFTEEGDALKGYFNPKTAAYLGKKIEPSKFFLWTTNLHRSLFLKNTGRFLVGLCSFLLLLITISGGILILKRQRGFKKFFSKIVNDNFAQYWHVVLGRLMLFPLLIITITGVYLSLERFNLIPPDSQQHDVDYNNLIATPKVPWAEMTIFKTTRLSEVNSVEFPFSDDVEDVFTIHLKDKEIVVNQFTGELLIAIDDSRTKYLSGLSLMLHTGQGSILWSLVLAMASANILFFIYSGFAMTLKRRAGRLKNKFKRNQAKYIILVGSENGGTLPFANALQKQLIAKGETVHIAELNTYRAYKKAEHIIIMTSTYGEGEAPTNAAKFLQRLLTVKQKHAYSFSVVGFGSLSYPDYCKFAFEVNAAFKKKNAKQLVPVFTINDKSFESFEKWVNIWSEKVGVPLAISQSEFNRRPKQIKSFEIVAKTLPEENPDNTFLITLKPKQNLQFTSGDLLAVYPNNDHRERLYSIGKVAGQTQLSVKHYDNGLGSGYLNACQVGDCCQARLIANVNFHLPKKTSKVIMIANGTGIAPFLGMLDENQKTVCEAYFGLRTEHSCELYKIQLEGYLKRQKLSRLHLAYSQQDERIYVQDLLKRDGEHIAKTLEDKGYIMICGSLIMYQSVMETLSQICLQFNHKPLNTYLKQIKSDCY